MHMSRKGKICAPSLRQACSVIPQVPADFTKLKSLNCSGCIQTPASGIKVDLLSVATHVEPLSTHHHTIKDHVLVSLEETLTDDKVTRHTRLQRSEGNSTNGQR